ncbi:MAG: hypothetical protein HOK84_07885 [Bacteroidetes bacterium]|nr:hypothetical protein [Bacteroidota bacterium]
MNTTFIRFSLLAIILLSAAECNISAQNETDIKLDCYSVVVGRNASADGSVLFAHNEDTGIKLVNKYKVPRRKHPAGAKITFENGGKTPQVAETFGYLWINMPGISVCDTYLNEHGVAIGSDGCPSKESKPELTDGGIVFWLRRIVAERALCAKDGVKIAGKLIDEFGYASSGRTYIIADPQEAWMLAVVHGKHWVAQRVPDDNIAVIPNYYTIGEIDLSDTINFMGSPDIIKYATEQGWYDEEKDGNFHFARAYTKPGSLKHPSNIRRMWRGLSLVSGNEFDLDDEFPFTIKPKAKVSVQDLMQVLRDHHEGTDLDKSKKYTLGSPYDMNGPMICARNTQYGVISQLRSWMPDEIGSLLWLAAYRPDVQAFSPWYSGVTEIPEVYYYYADYQMAIKQQFSPPEETFDRSNKHAFWTFVSLVNKIDENYSESAQQVKNQWNKREEKMLSNQGNFETKVLRVYKQNPDNAKKLLTKYSSKNAMRIYKDAAKWSR